ncbi:hypothetical protein LV779_38065 [Streptomyces thinghirensis]|nr:hypothetical protein [Streptomyces thinghirensis]
MIASRAATATALGDGLTALISGPDRRRGRPRRDPGGRRRPARRRGHGRRRTHPVGRLRGRTRAAARRAVPAARAQERGAGVRGARRPRARTGAGDAPAGARVAVPRRPPGAGRAPRRAGPGRPWRGWT